MTRKTEGHSDREVSPGLCQSYSHSVPSRYFSTVLSNTANQQRPFNGRYPMGTHCARSLAMIHRWRLMALATVNCHSEPDQPNGEVDGNWMLHYCCTTAGFVMQAIFCDLLFIFLFGKQIKTAIRLTYPVYQLIFICTCRCPTENVKFSILVMTLRFIIGGDL